MQLQDFKFLKQRDLNFVRKIIEPFGIEEQKRIETEYAKILFTATKELLDFEKPACIKNANQWLRSTYAEMALKAGQQQLIELIHAEINTRIKKQLKETYRADISSSLLRKFDAIKKTKSITEAVIYIEKFNNKHADFKFFSHDDADIYKLSEEAAEHCGALAKYFHKDLSVAIQNMHKYADSMHIERPAHINKESLFCWFDRHKQTIKKLEDLKELHNKDSSIDSQIRRYELKIGEIINELNFLETDHEILLNKYTDRNWWQARLPRIIRSRREELAIQCGLVNKKHSPHSSNFTREERGQQLKRNQTWAEKTIITDGKESFTMSELLTSKEACYNAEFYTLLKGLSNIQQDNFWHAAMITITCPSRMHPVSKKYDGTSIKKAKKYLSKTWARIRAKAKRDGLNIQGCQVWQPHKDGCPHQHIYVVGSFDDLLKFYKIAKHYAFIVDGKENGAAENRFDWLDEGAERVKNENGKYKRRKDGSYITKPTAAKLSSYVAKYVTRLAIDDNDEDASYALKKATSEDAWYSAHGIRRVSFFGLPPKKLWRYFRKATRKTCNSKVLKAIRRSARGIKDKNGKTIVKPDFAKFCELINWNGMKKELGLITKTDKVINKYGEAIEKEKSIIFKGVEFLKSTKKWLFETAPKPAHKDAEESINPNRTLVQNCPRAGKPASIPAISAEISAEIGAFFKNTKKRDLVPI